MRKQAITGAAALTLAALACGADANANWLLHGRTYNDQRFSELDQINEQTRIERTLSNRS